MDRCCCFSINGRLLPQCDVTYQHIDSLFSQTINWQLIETHWPDLLQVVLSIQAGKVLPSMLLQRLNSYSRKNKLYLAFRELGRAVRTLFLYVIWNWRSTMI